MRKPVASQLAKARSRRRVQAKAGAAEAVEPQQSATAEPELPPPAAVIAFPRDDEPPFDPPDLDDMLGLGDCEDEETEFVTITPNAPEPLVLEAAVEEEDLELVTEAELPATPANDTEEEAEFFDPPEQTDDIFHRFEKIEAAFPTPPSDTPPKPLSSAPRPERPAAPPLPAISLHLSWDRPETAAMFGKLAAGRRFASAQIEGMQGGIEAAIQRYSAEPAPDLLVLDTNLPRDGILSSIRRLFGVLGPATRVVVLSGVNDIALMRELANAGVSEYVVAPFDAAAIGEALCRLFEHADNSHVIAVIGARGGVGASTVAQNIAWSIAERQQASATLVDLDLAFGAVAANFKREPVHSVAEALLAPDDLDAAIDRGMTQHTPNLRLLSAPASVAREMEFDAEQLHAVVTRVRRTSSYVVLDLPHAWNDWIKHTLISADSVLIVSGPDLASLRNADNMLKLLRSESARVASPIIALSMVGVPKRPEIPAKDFSEALMLTPAESFAFDPALFAEAALQGQAIAEFAPGSKAARALDELATLITGREPVAAKPAPRSAPTPAEAKAELVATPQPVLELVQQAPAPDRFAEARKVGEAEIEQLAANQPKPRKRSNGMLRATAAMLVFGIAGAWVAEERGEAASAETTRVAPESPVIAVAPPLPSPAPVTLDNATRYASAVAMLEGGQVGEGIGALRALAEEGYAPAQYSMAKIYERGEGVERSAATAQQWTERAANAGHGRAMHDLGVYLARNGDGAEDDAAAFRWFRQAADYGVADSQFNLGVFYQQGRSVTADPSEALFWFMLAARDGDQSAADRARALESELTPVQVENARARAQAFRPQAQVAN